MSDSESDADMAAAAASLDNLKPCKLVRCNGIDKDYETYKVKQRIIELYREINVLRKRIKAINN